MERRDEDREGVFCTADSAKAQWEVGERCGLTRRSRKPDPSAAAQRGGLTRVGTQPAPGSRGAESDLARQKSPPQGSRCAKPSAPLDWALGLQELAWGSAHAPKPRPAIPRALRTALPAAIPRNDARKSLRKAPQSPPWPFGRPDLTGSGGRTATAPPPSAGHVPWGPAAKWPDTGDSGGKTAGTTPVAWLVFCAFGAPRPVRSGVRPNLPIPCSKTPPGKRNAALGKRLPGSRADTEQSQLR